MTKNKTILSLDACSKLGCKQIRWNCLDSEIYNTNNSWTARSTQRAVSQGRSCGAKPEHWRWWDRTGKIEIAWRGKKERKRSYSTNFLKTVFIFKNACWKSATCPNFWFFFPIKIGIKGQPSIISSSYKPIILYTFQCRNLQKRTEIVVKQTCWMTIFKLTINTYCFNFQLNARSYFVN